MNEEEINRIHDKIDALSKTMSAGFSNITELLYNKPCGRHDERIKGQGKQLAIIWGFLSGVLILVVVGFLGIFVNHFKG